MRHRASWPGLLLLPVLTLAACSGDDASPGTAVASSSPSSSLESYEGDGFTMLIPGDWTRVASSDLVGGSLGEGIEDELSDTLGSQTLASQVSAMFESGAFRLFAFDLRESEPGFVDNLNVLVLPRSGLTTDGLLSVGLQQLENYLGATIVSSDVLSMPAGDTVFIRYTQSPAGGNPVEGLSATIITETEEWTITFTATDVDRLDAVFQEILVSFRVAG